MSQVITLIFQNLKRCMAVKKDYNLLTLTPKNKEESLLFAQFRNSDVTKML